ncbi:hypothetical protein J6Y73_02285 [bacterium]|nr:hypothetical protein [bacterium]
MLYIVTGLIGIALWAIYYLLSFITKKYLVKDKKILSYFVPLIASIVPTIVILAIKNNWSLHFENMLDLEYWGAILLAVAVSSALTIVFSPSQSKIEPMELSMRCLHGGFMEIPERMMMQNFLVIMLVVFNLEAKHAVVITAVVLAIGIIIESIINKDKNYKSIAIKVLSSVIFSLLVGHVYFFTDAIIYCIVGHIIERFISNIFYIRKKFTEEGYE